MPMKLERIGLTMLFAAAAVSCSGPVAENGANAVDAAIPVEAGNVAEPEMPNLVGNETVQALPCPATPGSACVGPLVVRAEGFNLIADDRYIHLQGSLVFENRTSGPVRVAILDEPVLARLDRGGMLNVINSDGLGGVTRCGDDGPACLQEAPERFRTLNPGDSPLRVNTSMRGYKEVAIRASLPSVQAAEITLQVYAVEGSGTGETLSISLANVPLRNQASR